MHLHLPPMIAVLALLSACTPAANTSAVASAPTIGILEERPGATTEEAARQVVRAVFHKSEAGWQSYDPNCSDQACLAAAPANAPQETHWTISRFGLVLGEVTAHTPSAWALYSDVGQQELAAGVTAPTLGDRSNEYAPDAGAPLHQPLVASSPAAFADPELWATEALPVNAQQAVRASFRAQFAAVTNCANAAAPPLPRTYADADIEIDPSRTFVSAPGWRVATARLTGYACDGPLEGAYAEQTFAISPTNEARLLGEGYRLLDVGDYDSNGQSELIFVISQYNTGGYALYTNDFTQSAVFDFSYH